MQVLEPRRVLESPGVIRKARQVSDLVGSSEPVAVIGQPPLAYFIAARTVHAATAPPITHDHPDRHRHDQRSPAVQPSPRQLDT